MNKLLVDIQRKFAVFQKDVEQLVSKGNNVAGMKAHKATLELRSLLKEFRKMSVEVAK
ncbi:histone H1 [Bacteroides eggerthii]|uniref:histone H1 n=1 Tax=Bacteroides eggerthii TaxID=28111 RepID=UPI0018979E29|nr:histone H1 [Bacteroides eggerthii]